MIGVNALCNVFLRQTVVFIDIVVEEQCSYSRMNVDMNRLEVTSSIDSIDWKIERNIMLRMLCFKLTLALIVVCAISLYRSKSTYRSKSSVSSELDIDRVICVMKLRNLQKMNLKTLIPQKTYSF